MRRAVEDHTRRQTAASHGFSGFTDFRKQGCVESRHVQGAYDCYYQATFTPASTGKPMTVNGKARFRPTGHGFDFEDLGAQPK